VWDYALITVGGARGVISPRKALESTYAWQRRWTRVFTLGRLDPEPRPVTDRAVKIYAVASVILIGIGFPVLVIGMRRLLA
jgi:hypothetical protein